MSCRSLALAAVLAAAVTTPAFAASSASSAVSDSLTTSSGSVSDSFKGSSNSSSGDTKKAEGDYRVIEVATVAERPGRLRLVMQAVDPGRDGLVLEVPALALVKTPVVAGDTVRASARPYGLEFALAPTQQVFFLVIEDAWLNELPTRPVTL
jgi:opacity protein-like surface antigen